MKHLGPLLAAAVALAGCGGGGAGGGKPGCGTDDSCAAGSYCAHTPDGNVCWPDTVKPVIRSATMSCSDDPCRRDSVLHVTATASDDVAVGTVTAVLDVDPDHPRTLERVSGDDYVLDVPLAGAPFPWFEHAVGVTVRATDKAANAADDASVGSMTVTRAKWAVPLTGAGDLAFPLFSPAVLPDGQVVVAGSDGTVHFLGKTGSQTRAVAIGSLVSSPPAVGPDAIWLATADGKLHELRFNGTVVALPANCNTSQAFVGPPAVSGDHAFVGSKAEVMITADAAGFCTPANAAAAVSSPSLLTSGGNVIVATGASLRSMTLPPSGVLKDDWTGIPPSPAAPSLPDTISVPMAVDSDGGIWTTAQNGAVNRTSSAATTTTVVLVSGGSSGSIVLADGTVVVSDAAQRLVRTRSTGTPPWSTSDSFTGVPAVGLALTGSISTILVPTDQGRVYAVRTDDGKVQWSVDLSGQSLQPANIWTDPGATTSTAYLAGADGNLYAIIVDGALDTSAPWPKAFHDPQNTSNAGVSP